MNTKACPRIVKPSETKCLKSLRRQQRLPWKSAKSTVLRKPGELAITRLSGPQAGPVVPVIRISCFNVNTLRSPFSVLLYFLDLAFSAPQSICTNSFCREANLVRLRDMSARLHHHHRPPHS